MQMQFLIVSEILPRNGLTWGFVEAFLRSSMLASNHLEGHPPVAYSMWFSIVFPPNMHVKSISNASRNTI